MYIFTDHLKSIKLPQLMQMQDQAIQQFHTLGFPSKREEEWRYTDVSAIKKTRFSFTANKIDLTNEDLQPWLLDDCYHFVLINGCFSPEFSNLKGLPKEIIICSLATAFTHYPEHLQAALGKTLKKENHGFIHLNTGYFVDGLFVFLPNNSILDKPLQVINAAVYEESLCAPRNIIVLQENTQANIIETFIGLNISAYFTDAVTEIHLGKNADLTLYKLQNESDKAYHFGGTYVEQKSQAKFTHHNFALGGLLARCEIHCDLETGAICELNGLYLGKNRQHLDNHTRINHNKPDGISREFYKGILNDRARGVFQGRVIVAEDAQKTDSQMNNRNLLLSADAEIDTKPQLEIYADDVKCAHGMTIGQLEEKSIFYLQSRGIDLESAKHILTFAFANEMVDKICVEPLKELLQKQLLKILPID